MIKSESIEDIVKEMSLTGNQAAAHGFRSCKVPFISGYPITPSTPVIEELSKIIGNPQMNYKPYLGLAIGGEIVTITEITAASLAGIRAGTATSNQGLEYQNEGLHWAAALGVPIVEALATRGTMGSGWNIWPDDQWIASMLSTGCLVDFASNSQEIHDFIIMQYMINEDPRVYRPGLVAYHTSHEAFPTFVRDPEDVRDILPPPPEDGWEHIKFDPKYPMSFGIVRHPENGNYMESRINMHESIKRSRKVIEEKTRIFNKKFGTSYGALVEEYGCEDADTIIVAAGSIADKLRFNRGEKIGLIKMRFLQPFPEKVFQKYAKQGKDFVVLDRNIYYGRGGGFISTLINDAINRDEQSKNPKARSVVAGIGGREIPDEELTDLIMKIVEKEKLPEYLNADVEDGKIIKYEPREMVRRKKVLEQIHKNGIYFPPGGKRIYPLRKEEMTEDMRQVLEFRNGLGYDKRLLPGGTACPGCTNLSGIYAALSAMKRKPVVMVSPASCLNVIIGSEEESSANFPFANTGFAYGASFANGAIRGLKARGIDDVIGLCWMGDGGVGIGKATLMDVINRDDGQVDLFIVVNDNQAFQNTGGQLSSTTIKGAKTTTTPYGNQRNSENLAWQIFSNNNLVYGATVNPMYVEDLKNKFKTAMDYKGVKYFQMLQPCPSGAKFDPKDTLEICKAAVESWLYPLYQVVNGKLSISPASRYSKNSDIEDNLNAYFGLQKIYKNMTNGQFEEIANKCKENRDLLFAWDGRRIRLH